MNKILRMCKLDVTAIQVQTLFNLKHPCATVVPCANTLDPDLTRRYSASRPDPNCLTHSKYFSPKLSAFVNSYHVKPDCGAIVKHHGSG